jgi:hypothetical protein
MPQVAAVVAIVASVASTAATVSQMVQSWSASSNTYQDSGKSLQDARKYLETLNKTSENPDEKGDLQLFKEMMAELGHPVTVPDEINSAEEVRELRDGFAALLERGNDINLTDAQKAEIGKIIDTLGSVAVNLDKAGETSDPDGSGTAFELQGEQKGMTPEKAIIGDKNIGTISNTDVKSNTSSETLPVTPGNTTVKQNAPAVVTPIMY